MLEIMITVGGSDYYVSDEGHSGASFGSTSGSQYYFPFVAKPPRVKWASTDGGYITVEKGTLSLVSKPWNSNHPFSGTNFRNLLGDAGTTTNLPTIALKDSTKYAIFDGSLVFKSINEDLLNFSIESTNYDSYIADTTTTDISGYTQVVPWPFGYVNTVPNYVQTGAQTWANGASATHPGFSKLGHWVLEGNTISAPRYTSGSTTMSATAFDGGSATPAYSGGIVHVTGYGTAREGDVNKIGAGDKTSTQYDLLAYMTLDIGLSHVDITRTSISGTDLSIWQTEKISLVELFSKVCQSTNSQFFITRKQSAGTGEGSLFVVLVDRANNPTATALTPEQIISSSYRIASPLASVTLSMNWIDLVGPETKTLDLVSNNLSYGKKIKYKNYYGTNLISYGTQANVDAIRDIEKKPIATVVCDGIMDTNLPGDRFSFSRQEDKVNVDMLVRSIEWDWGSRNTTFSGDATLAVQERT